MYSKLYAVAPPTNFVDRGAALPTPLQYIVDKKYICTYTENIRET